MRLAAEDRLLERAANLGGPAVPLATVEKFTRRPDADGRMLGDDQAGALTRIAVSGRTLDLLVGPAGAGKTTAMNALRHAGEAEHGACILSLDRLTHPAQDAGAKVLLVGDYAQLQSVDTGGACAMIASDISDTPELVDVHRITYAWEKTASLELRHGRTAAIDTYLAHQRIQDGDVEAMTGAAHNAWRADRDDGLISVLIAETHEDVTTLNRRARAGLILNETLNPDREVELRDGTAASVSDTIITRLNNSSLRTLAGRDWVRNGDISTITIARDYGTGTTVRDDGTIKALKHGRRFGGSILLPASYVAEHVDLGYAVTAYRAQGVTTDTAHVLVEPTSTRETFYVAMIRW